MKNIRETIKTIIREESEYQQFFRKALEKAGKSIPDMSDEEKKAFFNKIDAAWDGKGEKNEGNAFGAAVVKAKEAGDDEFEVGGKTFKVESVNELPKATIPSVVQSKLNMAIDKIKDTKLTYNQKLNLVGKVMDSLGIDKGEFNKMTTKLKGTMESVNEAKKYDIGMGRLGNGTTVYNRAEEEWGDYKKIAHISDNGTVKYYDKSLPSKIKSMIEKHASKMRESVNEAEFNRIKDEIRLITGLVNAQKSLKLESINSESRVWTSAQEREVAKLDDEFRKYLVKKGIEPYSKEAADMWKRGGFQSKMKKIFGKNESVNENASRTAMEIGGLTGLNKNAVQKFVDDNNLDIEKVYQYVKKGKLSDRMDFATAVAGKTGNPIQKKLISKLSESKNETVDEGVGSFFKNLKNSFGSALELTKAVTAANKGNIQTVKEYIASVVSKYPQEKRKEAQRHFAKLIADKTTNKPMAFLIAKMYDSTNESINENFSADDIAKIKGAVESASSFMGIGNELKKLGMKYSFSTEPLAMYMIKKGSKTFVLINKRYADKPDFVVGNTAGGLLESKSVNEGKKSFKVNPGIGKAKYSISSHDGVKKHKDGSDFWDIKIFKNKVDLEKGINDYKSKGFIEESKSVNEGVKISLVDPNTNKFVKTLSLDRTYREAEGEVETLNKRLSTAQKDKGFYWKVTAINESKFKKGDKVTVDYPTLTKPLIGVVSNVLKGPNGDIVVLKGNNGVWDAKHVKLNEGNAFGMAVTKAKQEGKKEFEFNGKTYKVKKGSYEKNEAAKKLA
jgi:hypothetical protein